VQTEVLILLLKMQQFFQDSVFLIEVIKDKLYKCKNVDVVIEFIVFRVINTEQNVILDILFETANHIDDVLHEG